MFHYIADCEGEISISKQLRRLSREDSEWCLAQVQELPEYICLNEVYMVRNADLLLDSLSELLYAAPTLPCQLEITRYVGCVGHIMKDDSRFLDDTFDRLNIWLAAEIKVLLLRCILEMLGLDSDGSHLTRVGE
ncbi:uncharacterized protein [Penaeus vannamei]|uniref:uncharacterized protein n=1 Tax=Penaeus vannamei TaxID=6689 RepID=UPI00387F8D83